MFPVRKPVDANQVAEIVAKINNGANDSSVFGGYVWGVKRGSRNPPFLLVKHTASKKHNATFTASRCTKNVGNAVLEALAVDDSFVVVYPERF